MRGHDRSEAYGKVCARSPIVCLMLGQGMTCTGLRDWHSGVHTNDWHGLTFVVSLRGHPRNIVLVVAGFSVQDIGLLNCEPKPAQDDHPVFPLSTPKRAIQPQHVC